MGKVVLQWLFVHSFDKKLIEEAWIKANDVFVPKGIVNNDVPVSLVTRTDVNAYYWFTVGPSGSKLHWEEDDEHRARLKELIDWMSAYRYLSYPGHTGYQPFNWTLVEHDEDRPLDQEDGHAIVDDYMRHDRGAV